MSELQWLAQHQNTTPAALMQEAITLQIRTGFGILLFGVLTCMFFAVTTTGFIQSGSFPDPRKAALKMSALLFGLLFCTTYLGLDCIYNPYRSARNRINGWYDKAYFNRVTTHTYVTTKRP